MAALDVGELVSQAEKEGVTLSEMISRTLTAEQMDEMQSELRVELASNYGNIERFMRDVRIPSLCEITGLDELMETNSPIDNAELGVVLSDDTV